MRRFVTNRGGFTLVEILMVMAIVGIVTGAAFSLYRVHMRTAYTQDEVVDVQQNLRIAMDYLTRDLEHAGMLVPLSASPIEQVGSPQNGYRNFSTCLLINTGSPEGRYARVTKTKYSLALSNYSTSVDSSLAASGIGVGDRVRVVHPFDNSLSFSNYSALTVSGANGSTVVLQLPSGGTFPAGVPVNTGDVIAKINTPGVNSYPANLQKSYNNIVYTVVAGAANNGCPVGTSCLARQVNPATLPPPPPNVSEIVATNVVHLGFSYLLDPGSSYGEVADLAANSILPGSVKGVRITLTGQTYKKTDANWVPRTRHLTSVVRLRNRRIY